MGHLAKRSRDVLSAVLPIVLLSSSCSHPADVRALADVESTSVVVTVGGPGPSDRQCMGMTLIDDGEVSWSTQGALFDAMLSPRGEVWEGELRYVDGDGSHAVSLGPLEIEVGAGVRVSSDGESLYIKVVPTRKPRFLLAACMGRPDLTDPPTE